MSVKTTLAVKATPLSKLATSPLARRALLLAVVLALAATGIEPAAGHHCDPTGPFCPDH